MTAATVPTTTAYPLAPPLPAALQVEVTSACNLRCTMCLVRYRPPVNRLAGALPLPLFRRLVDEVPTLRQVTMQGLGEPLLAPHLLEMIEYAHARDIRVGFNSNATLLTRHMADRLVAAGLSWLHVSLDAADAATYESIRDGGNFSKVLANLSHLVEAKRAAGGSAPWIRVVFVAMRRNVGQLPALVDLLGQIGVGELRVQNLSHSFSDTDPAGSYQEIREYAAAEALWNGHDRAAAERAFAEARRRADELGLVLRLPRLDTPNGDGPASDVPERPGDGAASAGSDRPAGGADRPGGSADRPGGAARPGGGAVSAGSDRPGCTWPWDATYVTSGGVVQPCCMVMGDDRVTLGNLNRHSFPDIWAGPAYREFRRRLRDTSAGGAPEVCRGCSMYNSTF